MAKGRGGSGGSITFISSRASDRGSAGEYVWYAASKGGVNSLCIGLAREVAQDGIRVNCVSPGPVATEMMSPERQARGAAAVPMQRVADPDEIAEAVLFLASDAASYVTGANLAVAGGA
jgi:NAD(P)-dependent dehydrogenase (short-subunit alcohol dehydrogenase family)